MTYTLIDAAALFILVVSALLALSRGFVREGMSIIGWIAAIVIAFIFAPRASQVVDYIPRVNEILADNCEIKTIVGFAVVFVGAMIIFALFTPMFTNFIRNSALSSIDSGLGFLFGIARGIVIIILSVMVYNAFVKESQPLEIVDNSQTYQIFSGTTENVEEQIPQNSAGWFQEQFESLTRECRS